MTTIHRSDLSVEEVADALRHGLGPRYKVVPGMHMPLKPLAGPEPTRPDSILVGTHTFRVQAAQVVLTRRSDTISIHVRPRGAIWPFWVFNALRLVPKIRRILRDSTDLRPPG